jgi:uracil-DNA glycosylase family 4
MSKSPLGEEHIYVPAYGPIGAKIMFVGESPSTQEVVEKRPFVGPSGKELTALCKDVGIYRDNTWVSNVCKYYVPPDTGIKKIPFTTRAKNYGIDIQACLDELQNEVNSIKPNVIVPLGGTALWAFTGKTSITNYRGSILRGMGRKLVPTYHPAHLLHMAAGAEMKGYWNRQVMLCDLRRALAESHSPDINLPYRNLNVCRNSAQLADFIQRYQEFTRPSIDIEAAGTCIPVCIGIAFTPTEGICVPLWSTKEFPIPTADLVSMWIILAKFLAAHNIVGQNFKYDEDKINRLGFVIGSLASDTMLKAHAINPELPKRLAFNQSIFTREPFYKDEGMYEGSLSDLFIGCARDACVTKEIDLAMDVDLDELNQRPFYENFLMKLHPVYLDIEREGFTIDYTARDALFAKYIKWSEHLSYELWNIAGDHVNVNSPKQIALLLFENWKLPYRKGTGEEELTALLNNVGKTGVHNPTHRRGIEIILEKRRVDKTINNYLMAMPDFDGKMKTSYFLCLETGRTSTHQLDPPIRPTIEIKDEYGKKKKKSIGTPFQTMTKHGDIGADVRSQYIAEPEYIYAQADSAQAEARVVFLLADDEQALKDIDEHDYHALTASWFFGGSESDYSKKVLGYESPIRFAGKTLRHAGHLGAGKRRAATELNTQARKYKIPITIDESGADRALKIFHAKQPKIQKVFQASVISALEKNRQLIAPVPWGFDIKYGGTRTFFERWGEELFRQGFSYIPQRAISDSTKGAAIRLRRDHPKAFKERLMVILMESHDALLFMIKEKRLEEFSPIIKEEMERPIIFENCSIPRRNLIVPCELETGYNYQDLKKFKFARPEHIPLVTKPLTIQQQFEAR